MLAVERPGIDEVEVVVVDDGSKDGTASVVAAMAAQDHRVRLTSPANAGKAAAPNRAVAEAVGDGVVTLDADTIITPTTVGNLARHFALDEAVLSLAPTSVASGYQSRDQIAGRAYAAAAVADAVIALPDAGYFAEPIAAARLSALTMVRGAHDESAAASELARALDSMLLEQNRLWSDLTGVAWSRDGDPVRAELMADAEESVRDQLREDGIGGGSRSGWNCRLGHCCACEEERRDGAEESGNPPRNAGE